MKINHKIYDSIISEPFDVQHLANDVKIELHSLNQNEHLYAQYAPKAKFAIWSTVDSQTYRLLLEDTYYPRMRELYGKRVNQCMIDFWGKVEKVRGKLMKFVFFPVSILVFVFFIAIVIFGQVLGQTLQTILMAAALIGFIVVNVFVNRKIDNAVNTHNTEAVDKIKNIIGHKRFEELINEQQAHYDEFFDIHNDEEETAVVAEENPVVENVVEENQE